MVGQIKLRIVLPARVGNAKRGGHHFLSVAGQQMKALLEQTDQGVARYLALVDPAAADVHGLTGLLAVQERGLQGTQPALVVFGHTRVCSKNTRAWTEPVRAAGLPFRSCL